MTILPDKDARFTECPKHFCFGYVGPKDIGKDRSRGPYCNFAKGGGPPGVIVMTLQV